MSRPDRRFIALPLRVAWQTLTGSKVADKEALSSRIRKRTEKKVNVKCGDAQIRSLPDLFIYLWTWLYRTIRQLNWMGRPWKVFPFYVNT